VRIFHSGEILRSIRWVCRASFDAV
jgi:hypothetical protein